jgi:hypothetical protein
MSETLYVLTKRAIQESASGQSLDELTDRIAGSMDVEQRDDAFRLLLRQYVQNALTQARSGTSAVQAPVVPLPRREPEPLPVGATSTNGRQTPAAPKRHTSARLQAAASWWKRALDQQYNLDGHVWRLSDMSVDQIESLAVDRLDRANDLKVLGDRFSRLAKALRDRGLSTAADLSEDEAAELWGVAA